MSEIESEEKSQNSLERLGQKKKLLSEYKSQLSLAKTSLGKYQSLQHETTEEKLKLTTNQPTSIKFRDRAVTNTVPLQKYTTDAQKYILPSEKYKNKLSKLSGCHIDEYSYIINTITPKTPINFLIFGVGKDSHIWMNVNKQGKTVFVEDNPEWFKWAKETYLGMKAYLVNYGTKRKDWLNLLTQYSQGKECLSMVLPDEIVETKWDVIFVDAPAGYSEEMPGRMKSIYIAAKLAFEARSTDVFVHDCHRQVENIYSSYFFHQKNLVTEIRRLRHYKIIGGEDLLHQKSIKFVNKEQYQSGNIQVEVAGVELLKPVSSLLHGCYLDRPKKGQIFQQNTIKLAGWVVGNNSPAVAVEIISNGQVIQTASINKQRSGVAKAYPQVAHAKTSGFSTEIQVISLPKESELTLQAILKDKSRVPLGSLKLQSKYQSSIGVIYIATGEKFIREACESVASLKAKMPNLPVTIFASEDIKNSNFDQVIVIEKPDYNHVDKIKYMYASPYDYTLFLDTDTYISANFSEIFTLLDKFDMGVAHAPLNIRGFVNGVPESFQQLNTGVILYKKSPQLEKFFVKWLELYKPPNADQPTFREVLYNSKLRISTLAPEYNCRFPFSGVISGTVKILHGRHKNLPLVAEKINSGKGLRFINPEEFKHLEKNLKQSTQVTNNSLPNSSHNKLANLQTEVVTNNIKSPKNKSSSIRDTPMLTPEATNFLENFLKQKPDANVLEFGSGGSTIWMSKLTKKLISIEHDTKWYKKVKDNLQQDATCNPVDLRLLSKPYHTVCDKFPQEFFDLIIVDGRDRMKCLEASIKVLKKGGILMVDDAQREKYKPAYDLLKDWLITKTMSKPRDTYWWQKPLPMDNG
ncbi:MAG: hypothetical protein F6K54_06225 [Okeania sp. SIO3B5]|uniref:class I SAM-dependent methyltransferase n=1 Tax=Okeania sp. SIO3B5 TaxID=2607811 RepID=UPI001400CD26|nr:class I SAM-dependent methyltransferase [Okeania sp. SIO3B5]NEO52709.1 hypothetical protein [Okeania sp. SIO3B5]